MKFGFQVGHQMGPLCLELTEKWESSTSILGPRNLSSNALLNTSKQLRAKNGQVLLDPQFFMPHTTKKTLIEHDFWPDSFETSGFFGGPGVDDYINKLYLKNKQMGCYAFIAPMRVLQEHNDDDIELIEVIANRCLLIVKDMDIYLTIALSYQSVKDGDFIEKIIEFFENQKDNNIKGAYIVAEKERSDYFIGDSDWLSKLTELCAGIRLQEKNVILGFAHQQYLFMGAACVDIMMTGPWQNMRNFDSNIFNETPKKSLQRSPWYYSPNNFAEYKLSTLDKAMEEGVLDLLKPLSSNVYADKIFNNALKKIKPSTKIFGESDAFRHYMQSMRNQVNEASLYTFDKTYDYHMKQLDDALNLGQRLERFAVFADRPMTEPCFNANRSALITLKNNRGTMLKRKWFLLH